MRIIENIIKTGTLDCFNLFNLITDIKYSFVSLCNSCQFKFYYFCKKMYILYSQHSIFKELNKMECLLMLYELVG